MITHHQNFETSLDQTITAIIGSDHYSLLFELEIWVAIAGEGQRAITVLLEGVLGRILAIRADAITKAVTFRGDIAEGHEAVSLSDGLRLAIVLLAGNLHIHQDISSVVAIEGGLNVDDER